MADETKAILGMVGLGRMGANMVERLQKQGIQCAAFDKNQQAVEGIVKTNAYAVSELNELIAKLERPRRVWMMVPAGITPQVASEIVPLLDEGDILIDGGNSHYREAVDKSEELSERGIFYVDIGTSGGVYGLERGYCLMVGGADEAVQSLKPILAALAPGAAAAPLNLGGGAA